MGEVPNRAGEDLDRIGGKNCDRFATRVWSCNAEFGVGVLVLDSGEGSVEGSIEVDVEAARSVIFVNL